MEIMEFVAGTTVCEALCKAHNKAKALNKPVVADINDIMMLVDKKTDVTQLGIAYRQKLDLKYEIEQIKRTR
jgi:hypothetical protein